MSKITITPDKLAKAVEQELKLYHQDINAKLIDVTRQAMTDLVKETKKTAPVGARGSFKKNIAGDFRGLKTGLSKIKATWYVKAPDHRLTHLLVKGHATKKGGRTKADPFLENALDKVLPAFEEAVKEAVRND